MLRGQISHQMEETTTVKETKFKSPVPILKRIRNFLLGKERPDIYTRITFWIALIISLVFLLWNVLGYVAVSSQDWILSEKGIDIGKIIDQRGEQLGFASGEFSSRLSTFYSISAICWIVLISGLFLLYRKRRTYIYMVFGAIAFFFGMIFFYIGFGYFVEDITFMDKVALLILLCFVVVHAFLIRNERQGRSISLFGEDEDEDDE